MTNEIYNLDYLKKSNTQAQKEQKEYDIGGSIQIFIKDRFENNIDVGDVLSKISTSIPPHLLREVDVIYIGMFDEFVKRWIQTLCIKDGAIYISK